MRFKEQKVIITGASSGIGRACAESFAKEGADLVLCARHEQRLKEVCDRLISAHGVQIQPLIFDITNASAVEKALGELPASWQKIDILINNAGLALGYDKLYAGNLQEWDTVIDTNLKGVVYMTRFVAGGMVKRQQGHIINIGSISSRQTYSGGSVYCASKFAVRGLTDTLRMDLHGSQVRVSLIDPGMVKTDFFDVRLQNDSDKVAALFAGLNPLTPQDVADAVIYCASRPPHVTIQEITIMPTDQTSGQMIYRRETKKGE
jgi:3-hydroxy acid dehydrogenase / malonic semialdehyde reductase